ncbi:MAG: ABC transporter substrate-binding protein, partial [Actinobacteria bacterium]|nr:ABC transporter substrate-binding protein [Actinomycetota bacterium]
MFKRSLMLLGAVTVAALAHTSCAGGGGGKTGGGGSGLGVDLNNLATTTTPGTENVDRVTWNLPYEPLSLDPMLTFNYAENTVDANLCDSLLRMNPDLTTGPGLAEKVDTPDDTTLVYTIRDGVKFWDGTPLTPADVVYSIDRQSGANNADSYYSEYFTSVKSVQQTGAHEVTVHLSKP